MYLDPTQLPKEIQTVPTLNLPLSSQVILNVKNVGKIGASKLNLI